MREGVIDIRERTRDSDLCITQVSLFDPEECRFFPWIIFGETSWLGANASGRWTLKSRFSGGVTDQEHSSAYALCLPLVGVAFEHVDQHRIHASGWVDASPWAAEEFRVPGPKYDPRTMPDAFTCDSEGCDPRGHLVIPHFVPPPNLALWKRVRGERVEIRAGVLPRPE